MYKFFIVERPTMNFIHALAGADIHAGHWTFDWLMSDTVSRLQDSREIVHLPQWLLQLQSQ